MAVTVTTYCRRCNEQTNSNDKLIEGETVCRCLKCDEFWLEGDHMRFSGPDEHVVEQLKIRADDNKRWREMIESDANDPRWVRLS